MTHHPVMIAAAVLVMKRITKLNKGELKYY